MKFGYCPRGGQRGILVSKAEMRYASSKMFPQGPAWDMAIPIPLGAAPRCASHDGDIPTVYWERPDGSHGWACGRCGEVVQWG